MPRKGKNFELDYKFLYSLDQTKYQVTSPAYVFDKVANKKREVDVLIEYNDSTGKKRKVSVECRDRKNIENVMWIEQLVQKKEDCELDGTIAVTKTKFSDTAINKARHYGIIVETAEEFNLNTLENIENEFYLDICFIKMIPNKITYCSYNGKQYSLKEITQTLNLIETQELINTLNNDIYYNIGKILNDANIDEHTFFDDSSQHEIPFNEFLLVNENAPILLKKLQISSIFIKADIIPFRKSIPLNKSLAIFSAPIKTNKKYISTFEDNEDKIEIGYLDNEINIKVKLKKRKYYCPISGNLSINTIFPGGAHINFNIENIKEAMGEFDFSKAL